MVQNAKLDSTSEIIYPYDEVHFNLKGICTGDWSRGSTAILNVCTYNVRTLRTEDDPDRLTDSVDQIKWDIVGLCELTERGWDCHWMYETDKTENNLDAKGLAFLIHPNIKNCITDFKTHSNRVTKKRVNIQWLDLATAINAYAPTSSAEDENLQQFW